MTFPPAPMPVSPGGTARVRAPAGPRVRGRGALTARDRAGPAKGHRAEWGLHPAGPAMKGTAMPTRRQTLALTLPLAAGVALATGPAAAQSATAARPNPMPAALRTALERDPTAPVLGNPKGDITLSEFFDYNCPHCKTIMPMMQRLIAADPGLRVVFREWPVFGEDSEFAARAALAALPQGKYWQMHAGLMGIKGRATEASVMRVVRRVGLDEGKLRAEMQSDRVSRHINASFELADHMGLVGTPTLIAGDEAVFGHQSLDDLKALVARGRKTLGV